MKDEHPWVGKAVHMGGTAHLINKAEEIMTLGERLYTRFWVACEEGEIRTDIGRSYIIEAATITCLRCQCPRPVR